MRRLTRTVVSLLLICSVAGCGDGYRSLDPESVESGTALYAAGKFIIAIKARRSLDAVALCEPGFMKSMEARDQFKKIWDNAPYFEFPETARYRMTDIDDGVQVEFVMRGQRPGAETRSEAVIVLRLRKSHDQWRIAPPLPQT